MSDIIKETFTLTLTYEMVINQNTGELLETRLVDRSVDKSDIKPSKTVSKKKVIKDTDTEPKLYLEDNKFKLNSAAIDLMGLDVESGVKIDIRYEDNKGKSTPIIGIDEVFGTKGGCKLTKTGTVSFRGVKNTELSKYGAEFTIAPHTNKPGLFVLLSDKIQEEVEIIDETINVDDDELPFDLDLKDIVENEDANITEINSDFFKL